MNIENQLNNIYINNAKISSLTEQVNIINNTIGHIISNVNGLHIQNAHIYSNIETQMQSFEGFDYMLKHMIQNNIKQIQLQYNTNVETKADYFNFIAKWLVDMLVIFDSIYYDYNDKVVSYTNINKNIIIDQNYQYLNENYKIRDILTNNSIYNYEISITRTYGLCEIDGKRDGYVINFLIY